MKQQLGRFPWLTPESAGKIGLFSKREGAKMRVQYTGSFIAVLVGTGIGLTPLSGGTLCASGAGLDTYIANYIGVANACSIGDKLFYNFSYSASSNPPGNLPPLSGTSVLPDPGDGVTNPGLLFSLGGFTVIPGETLDANITYSIATQSGLAVLQGYSLTLAGSHSAAPLGLASGTVTESFLNAPLGTPLVTAVGPGAANSLSANVSFLPWDTGTIVSTQIHLQSPFEGTIDIVTLSAIQEHFSEAIFVPEPRYDGILFGAGLLLLWRKRVHPSRPA